jgi:chromosome segregation ATPase
MEDLRETLATVRVAIQEVKSNLDGAFKNELREQGHKLKETLEVCQEFKVRAIRNEDALTRLREDFTALRSELAGAQDEFRGAIESLNVFRARALPVIGLIITAATALIVEALTK